MIIMSSSRSSFSYIINFKSMLFISTYKVPFSNSSICYLIINIFSYTRPIRSLLLATTIITKRSYNNILSIISFLQPSIFGYIFYCLILFRTYFSICFYSSIQCNIRSTISISLAYYSNNFYRDFSSL